MASHVLSASAADSDSSDVHSSTDSDADSEEHSAILFYKYVAIADPDAFADEQRQLCSALALTGRVRVAREGINGTLAGATSRAREYVGAMARDARFADVDWKWSRGVARGVFDGSLRVLVKPELVALGVAGLAAPAPPPPGADAAAAAAATGHLAPEEFDAALRARDAATTVLLDVRNGYESQVGRFADATDPRTRNFSQLPAWCAAHAERLRAADAVYIYCTGGIRCEKARELLLSGAVGAQRVYQLRGGIHRYLEAYPDGGLFRGKNFVFDRRVAVPPGARDDVFGRCERCAAPWDEFRDDVRCAVCRMLVLLCPACAGGGADGADAARGDAGDAGGIDARAFLCAEHREEMVAPSTERVAEDVARLRSELKATPGRGNKSKRRALVRRIDRLEAELASRAPRPEGPEGVAARE